MQLKSKHDIAFSRMNLIFVGKKKKNNNSVFGIKFDY